MKGECAVAFTYRNQGTCSRGVSFDIVDGRLTGVQFDGGCNGNTQGISRLVEGMPAEEAVRRLSGIRCGYKPTSCPDQLAKAIEKALAEQQN